MDLFDQYELEFTRQLSSSRQRLNQITSFTGEKRKAALSELDRQLDELKEIINKMEKSAKSAAPEKERRMTQKLRGYSADLNRLQRDVQHASLISTTTYGNPSMLPSDPFDEYQAIHNEHRQQILGGTEKLGETTGRLHNAHRIAVQNENIGVEVLGELVSQRKQLENVNANLDHIDENMKRSRKILSSMARRVATNKFILALIIIILFAANALIIYFKWISPLIKKANL